MASLKIKRLETVLDSVVYSSFFSLKSMEIPLEEGDEHNFVYDKFCGDWKNYCQESSKSQGGFGPRMRFSA